MRLFITNGCQSGAVMTEVALALAMAFFSIMILSMVSMGGSYIMPLSHQVVDDQAKISKLETNSNRNASVDTAEISLIIYYEKKFYDDNLTIINPKTYLVKETSVLAVPPSISVTEVLEIQQNFNHENLTITTLDEHWLDSLNRM